MVFLVCGCALAIGLSIEKFLRYKGADNLRDPRMGPGSEPSVAYDFKRSS